MRKIERRLGVVLKCLKCEQLVQYSREGREKRVVAYHTRHYLVTFHLFAAVQRCLSKLLKLSFRI